MVDFKSKTAAHQVVQGNEGFWIPPAQPVVLTAEQRVSERLNRICKEVMEIVRNDP